MCVEGVCECVRSMGQGADLPQTLPPAVRVCTCMHGLHISLPTPWLPVPGQTAIFSLLLLCDCLSTSHLTSRPPSVFFFITLNPKPVSHTRLDA